MQFYTTSRISENILKTPEGFLVCVGVPIARAGEMIYGPGESPIEVGPEGKAVIFRDAREVFRPETIGSFQGKPVTILHPDKFVDPENWGEIAKGLLQNVRRGKGENENDLVSDLLITDKVAIQLVEDGLREVSCGYLCDYVETGVGRGYQTNIIGNHLALVEAGRAGQGYAINDHKGKGSEMKLKDQIKSIFSKAGDEAAKLVSETAETKDSVNTETPETKTGFVTMKDMAGYFDAKFDEMKGSKEKDASSQPNQFEPAEVKAKDEEAEKKKAAEDRKAARDAWIDAQMEKQASDADADGDNDGDEADDEEPGMLAGDATDSASRIEILAPGMDAAMKGAKRKALIACFATKDGKAVIERFTGGKRPDFNDEKAVDALVIGVSEVLKSTRSEELSSKKIPTKDAFTSSMGISPKGGISAEAMNKKNEEHYSSKQKH